MYWDNCVIYNVLIYSCVLSEQFNDSFLNRHFTRVNWVLFLKFRSKIDFDPSDFSNPYDIHQGLFLCPARKARIRIDEEIWRLTLLAVACEIDKEDEYAGMSIAIRRPIDGSSNA